MNQLIKTRAQTTHKPTVADNRRLSFYAAIFDSPTTVTEFGKTFREVVKPSAFTRSLSSGAEVVANLEHKEPTFSRRSQGLLLQADPKGLFASCWLPEDELGDRIIQDVKSGRFTGCSFAFRNESAQDNNGILELHDLDLIDVCLTADPCYPDTEIHLRAKETEAYDLFYWRLRILRARR